MNTRRLTPLDRLLASANNALRTVAAPAGDATRPYPAADIPDTEMDEAERRHAAGLMRVNHAGEVAAQALYQGHAAVARDDAIEAQIKDAAVEEFDHLAWCERRLQELGETPSRLAPLWYTGSFLIGAASGVLGDRWSLGFIAETEKQVCEHLDDHLEGLPPHDNRSRAVVRQMREEEAEHGEHARAAGAAVLPLPVRRLMRMTARVMTRSAYWL
jgi:ubiquinone biosynthesis monooxygenase Coq7